jgi:hypothetical protein
MEEKTLEEIKNLALELHNKGIKWHFHILGPACMLNTNFGKYVFILESSSANTFYVHYSDKAEKELGKALVPLLHGNKIFESTEDQYKPNKNMKKILQRAKELKEKQTEWHHHMLFPDCKFNKKSPQWVLMLEDTADLTALESLSETEPVNDLKQIESLFYN